MTYHERDGWDEVGDQGNGILGAHLKFAKGRVFLDGAEIGIGDDGIRFCVIMDSATAGKLLRLEQAHQHALENHLHRNKRVGLSVVISETWY